MLPLKLTNIPWYSCCLEMFRRLFSLWNPSSLFRWHAFIFRWHAFIFRGDFAVSFESRWGNGCHAFSLRHGVWANDLWALQIVGTSVMAPLKKDGESDVNVLLNWYHSTVVSSFRIFFTKITWVNCQQSNINEFRCKRFSKARRVQEAGWVNR